MNIRTILVLLYCALLSREVHSIPRCEDFYNTIYNETEKFDVNKYTYEDHLTIGIRLEKFFNEEKNSWELETNSDGYYKVGKITNPFLIKKINVGDVIISINDIDLREIKKEDEKYSILENDVSELFEIDELIKFKILKSDEEILVEKNNIDEEIKVTKETFSAPYIDFFLDNIEIKEKEGLFIASIETSYLEHIDDRYFLAEKIWDKLVYTKVYDSDNFYENFWWEQCDFEDDRWGLLNTEDPAYGMKFNNLVKEDKQVRESYYNIKPAWEWTYHEEDWKIAENGALIEYYSTSVYTFKNYFNLRTFPFDKQRIKIHLYNSKFDYLDFRSLISSDSMKDALYFKDNNQIEGWNIVNVDLVYEHFFNDKEYTYHDGVVLVLDVERKSGYYLFKIILPIFLILAVCWSAIWIDPKEIESRLTITIVCLLSLIAYNFVIDSQLPKLEYLTIMDYIILVSYFYATIPNFISIARYRLITSGKDYLINQTAEKYLGLPSYIIIILLIIFYNISNNTKNSSGLLLGVFN